MGNRVIRVVCQGSRMASLASLVVIQGELKELSEENYRKLRWRIETMGFAAPVFVWQDKILDGTQRTRVLQKMVEDGWKLPGGVVPVCDIAAQSLDEAKDRLLGYVSQYGTVTAGGLDAFLEGMDTSAMDTVDIPGFDLGPGGSGDSPGDYAGQGSGDDAQDSAPQKIQVMCPECGEEFLIDGS